MRQGRGCKPTGRLKESRYPHHMQSELQNRLGSSDSRGTGHHRQGVHPVQSVWLRQLQTSNSNQPHTQRWGLKVQEMHSRNHQSKEHSLKETHVTETGCTFHADKDSLWVKSYQTHSSSQWDKRLRLG